MNEIQKHFLCTQLDPPYRYSCFVMNIGWKLLSEARIDPPIQAENFLSGGSNTFIFIVEGAKAITYLCILYFKSALIKIYV
jgi:hypothetical protein